MEAAVEELFDFMSFEGDGLQVSFVVVVEERQGLSRVCRGRETKETLKGGDKNSYCFCLLLSDCINEQCRFVNIGDKALHLCSACRLYTENQDSFYDYQSVNLIRRHPDLYGY